MAHQHWKAALHSVLCVITSRWQCSILKYLLHFLSQVSLGYLHKWRRCQLSIWARFWTSPPRTSLNPWLLCRRSMKTAWSSKRLIPESWCLEPSACLSEDTLCEWNCQTKPSHTGINYIPLFRIRVWWEFWILSPHSYSVILNITQFVCWCFSPRQSRGSDTSPLTRRQSYDRGQPYR